MLEVRPNCECCDKNLRPDAPDAMICTYECTFCRKCVETILENVCPNCGGGFEKRPVRPKTPRRQGTGLESHPATAKRHYTKYSMEELIEFAQRYKHIPPSER